MNRLSDITPMIAVSLLIACSSLPSVTRTGMVKDVLIKDEISPTQITVRTGDEIRWINRRQGPVKIIFLQPVEDQISCLQGFGSLGTDNATRLEPNESASLCFSKPGPIKYTIRGESSLPTGEVNLPGKIQVEERTG